MNSYQDPKQTSSSYYLLDINHQKTFLHELAKKLNINTPESWYKVTESLLIQHGGSELLSQHNDSLIKLLSAVYPEYQVYLKEHVFTFYYISGRCPNSLRCSIGIGMTFHDTVLSLIPSPLSCTLLIKRDGTTSRQQP